MNFMHAIAFVATVLGLGGLRLYPVAELRRLVGA
jgi:hypothetical protein